MRFIARFAMRGRFHAAAAAALVHLGSLSLEPLLIVSGAVIALATLRHGSREGLTVLVLATAMVVAVSLALSAAALPMFVFCLVVWMPAWLMALNLRRTQRQAYPLLMAATLVGAYAIAFRAAVGDVGAFWYPYLREVFSAIAAQTELVYNDELVSFLAEQMHVWSMVSMLGMLVSIILVGRWWQAALFNPGGFGAEFRELSLPRAMLYVAMAVGLLVIALKGSGNELGAVGDVFVIVVVSFAFQGLALIHYRVKSLNLANGWLVGMYVMLGLTPHIVGPVLATSGVADALADFRRLKRTESTPPPPRSDGDNQDESDDGT